MNYKISFCTVSMDRLHHLKQTLPQNIVDNLGYPNVEFVLLDYNSKDGLEEWVNDEMSEYIDSGILVYYKTEEPTHFHRSHSRNVMFKLASGDILVNLDADNFAGKDFASFVNDKFNEDDNIFMAPKFGNGDGAYGKVCVKKEDFLSIRGYDEEIAGWGSEDTDFYYRLKFLGRNQVSFEAPEYLECIAHGDEERVNNQENFEALHRLYCIVTNEYSKIILLFNDNTLERGTVIYNVPEIQNMVGSPWAVLEGEEWVKGEWTFENGTYSFMYTNADPEKEIMKNSGGALSIYSTSDPKKEKYFRMDEMKDARNQAVLLHEATKNYLKFKENYDNNRMIVNLDEFGITEIIPKKQAYKGYALIHEKRC